MTLKIKPEKAFEQINIYLNRVNALLKTSYKEGSSEKSELDSEIEGFLISAFEDGDNKGYTSSPGFFIGFTGHIPTESEKQEDYISSLNIMKMHLIKFRSEVQTIIDNEIYDIVDDEDVLKTLELIFSNFHRVVRQLRQRHGDRDTINVNDEYDVQDLLHGILKIFFSDIRPEEYTPSYAGSHRRMDFLLKNERIVIEVKMTRETLKNKKISEELNDDIVTYKSHNDCNILVCFIYDPEGWINNPVGFEKDLSDQSSDKLQVKAYISPK